MPETRDSKLEIRLLSTRRRNRQADSDEPGKMNNELKTEIDLSFIIHRSSFIIHRYPWNPKDEINRHGSYGFVWGRIWAQFRPILWPILLKPKGKVALASFFGHFINQPFVFNNISGFVSKKTIF